LVVHCAPSRRDIDGKQPAKPFERATDFGQGRTYSQVSKILEMHLDIESVLHPPQKPNLQGLLQNIKAVQSNFTLL